MLVHSSSAEACDAVVSTLRFAITSRPKGADAYVIVVEGELDLFRTPELKQAFLDRVADGARLIVVDLSGTTFVDSTAAALLMTLPALMAAGEVAVVCDEPQILRTLAVTGVDRRVRVAGAASAPSGGVAPLP